MTSAYHVYAIVGRDTALHPGAGYEADELSLVPFREVAAVVRLADHDDASISMDAVLRHEAIVEGVRHRAPALPVRFGTVFRDVKSVTAALAARYESIALDLERLGDKVEMSLTALWTAPPSSDAATSSSGDESLSSPSGPSRQSAHTAADGAAHDGARYLYARAAELRHGDALEARARVVARTLGEALDSSSLQRRVSLVPTPRIALRTAYLLDPAGVGAFRAAFTTVCASRRDVRVLLTGPWPPYSFVGRQGAVSETGPDGGSGGIAMLLRDTMRGRSG